MVTFEKGSPSLALGPKYAESKTTRKESNNYYLCTITQNDKRKFQKL